MPALSKGVPTESVAAETEIASAFAPRQAANATATFFLQPDFFLQQVCPPKTPAEIVACAAPTARPYHPQEMKVAVGIQRLATQSRWLLSLAARGLLS